MRATDIDDFKMKLRDWHDSHLVEYNKVMDEIARAHQGDMSFFANNMQMLGYDTAKILDQTEYTPSDALEATPSAILDGISQDMPGMRENVILSVEADDPRVLSLYYFLLCEGGGGEYFGLMEENADGICGNADAEFPQLFTKMMQSGVENDLIKKGDMVAASKITTRERLSRWLRQALAVVKGKRGKRKSRRRLVDLLEGEQGKLLSYVEQILAGRENDTETACLYVALTRMGLIAQCTFTEFFESLRKAFPDMGLGIGKRGQAMSSLLLKGENARGDYYEISENRLKSAEKRVLVIENEVRSVIDTR